MNLKFVILVLYGLISNNYGDGTVNKLWGPGLMPHKIVMPARYFFIQLGTNFNKKPEVSITGKSIDNRPCRIWTEVLNRKDNFFIVRYKIHEVCVSFKISVTLDNTHLHGSPFVINRPVLTDDCYCPEKNLNNFIESWNCGNSSSVLKQQIFALGKINWNKQRQELIDTFDKPLSISLCHYVVKSNEIYRKCYGKYVDFKMFVDKILLTLSRRVSLPDIEFFANLGDWPLSSKKLPKKYPILSWCGSTSHYDVIMPTYEITESVLENMGKVSVNTLSVQGNLELPWEKRIEKLFWRGRDSNQHRLDLILIGRQHPDLINASLTNFFFYRDKEHIYGPKTDYISLYKFFDFKYQLAIDGTVAPYRMPYLLAGGSLVFKPHSEYYEHFYKDLVPNVHYIPVNKDLSDLVDKIKWAKKNDKMAKKIATNAQNFANERLSPKNIYCYHAHIFKELSKIIESPIEVLEDMEKVTYDKQQECQCSFNKKDEL